PQHHEILPRLHAIAAPQPHVGAHHRAARAPGARTYIDEFTPQAKLHRLILVANQERAHLEEYVLQSLGETARNQLDLQACRSHAGELTTHGDVLQRIGIRHHRVATYTGA